MKTIYVTVVATQLYAWTASGQAFTNLNFEAATIPQTQALGPVSVTAALPGWNVFAGPTQLTEVLFNDETLGTTSVSLLGTMGGAIEGDYSVLLQGYATAPGASISQTAVVPALTRSILFMAQPDAVPGTLLVSLGAQNIPVFTLGTGPNYTLYGGEIPATLAGQLEELQITAPESFTGPNDWNIDSIVFSPDLIPEPGTWALILCGAGLFAIRLLSPHHGQVFSVSSSRNKP